MTVQTRLVVEDGALIASRTQDCTPILEKATRLRNDRIHGAGDMRHAATLPAVIVERYINENGITFAEFLKNQEHARRLLNDPALKGFRVWEGRA